MTGKAPKSAFATFFFSDLEPINATSLSEDIRAFGVATCLLKIGIAERESMDETYGGAAEEVIVDSAIRKSRDGILRPSCRLSCVTNQKRPVTMHNSLMKHRAPVLIFIGVICVVSILDWIHDYGAWMIIPIKVV